MFHDVLTVLSCCAIFRLAVFTVAHMYQHVHVLKNGEGKLRIETSGGEEHRRPRLT
jgi:hypothetical protein